MKKLALLLLLASPLYAVTKTVKAGGGGDYTTISACVAAISAGDTCQVFVGSYTENPTIPAGTAGNYKTVIANGNDIITITGTVTLNSHTKLIGNCPELQGTKTTATCGFFITRPASPTSSCVTFANNSTDIYLVDNNMYACGSINQTQNNSVVTSSVIKGNTVSYPCSTSSSPNVCLAMYITGNNQLIANNDLNNTSDGINMLGSHNIFRGNTMHDTPTSNCGSNSSNCHIDFIQSEPNFGPTLNPATQFNVIERGTEVNNVGNGNGHGYLTQADVCSGNCFNAIIRFNQGAHVDSGGILDDLGGFTNVKAYNNTWVDFNSGNFSSGNITAHWKGASSGGSALNSIFYYPGSATNFNPIACEDTSCSPFNFGHDIAFCGTGCGTAGSGLRSHLYGSGAWTGDPGNLYADPLFNSYSSSGIGNLSLQPTSPARNAGTNLTTVNGTISSSTTLVVADAGYFQDGMSVPTAQGDCISVTTVTNHACITAVNYATNTLTLSSPISATNGDPVWIYSISDGTVVLSGPAPNMGSSVTQTWYVRPDGGTRWSVNATSGQCDGLADVAYPGSGVNQHCAFNDYRWLYDDQTFAGTMHWVIAGGDTVIIRGCASGPSSTAPDCRVGSDSAAGSAWGPGVGNIGNYNPPIPAGTAGQHTRILGGNYASCSVGNAPDKTKMTQLFGGWGLGLTLNLTSTSYVDVSCIQLWRHSDCQFFGVPNPKPCNRNPGTYSDYVDQGIVTNASTSNVTLTDMWIHGMLSRGVIGPIGGPVTATRVDIDTNGDAGWDFDDGSSTPMGVGALWTFNYSTIKWSGCQQEYPVVHAIPVGYCYSQSTGGYGDAVGTPAGTGLSVSVDHSTFIYNTQDGLDLGHVDTGGPYTLSVTNSDMEHNGGSNAPKFDNKFNNSIITNNRLIGDCSRMSAPIAGAPNTFNQYLSDFCRAGDMFPFNFEQGRVATIANNTIVSYAPTMFDSSCNDVSCTTATLHFVNNIVLGYANLGARCGGTFPACAPGFADNPGSNYGGTNIGPSLWFYQNGGPGIRDFQNNIYSGTRQTCPTGFDNGTCSSPQLVGQPTNNGSSFIEGQLDNFNILLTSSSPAIGAGINWTGIPLTDFFGTTQTNPAVIGAAVFSGGGPVTVATPTALPLPNAYTTAQSVVLSTTTGGATICVTTDADGSTPTATSGACNNGFAYTSPIPVAVTTTIKAIGTFSGDTNSSVASFAYTITVLPVTQTTATGNVTFSGTVTHP